tara:strand:- start:2401 stop:2826 length:426 start_codon:yes stop_codon:yes gene_type:complete
MKSIDIKDLDKLALDYPYLFLPYLFKLNKNSFKKHLNSLAIRHPNRVYLKEFIENKNLINLNFINDFIKKNPKIKKKKTLIKQDDLALKRMTQKEFITENMAKIYIKQNKIKEAIKIYEKLISLNSKKKSYFAKKIQNLKN